jgi:hypothetical protein
MCLQARRLADFQPKAIGRTHLNSGYVQERRVEAHNDGAPGAIISALSSAASPEGGQL